MRGARIAVGAVALSGSALVASGCPDTDCHKTLTCPCSFNEECQQYVEAQCMVGVCGADGICGEDFAPLASPCNENGGAYCDGQGNCSTKLPNGLPCMQDDECLNGDCADGLCCDRACDRACEACDVAGMEGACTAYEKGTDPETECAPGEKCNGAGACAKEDNGEPCTDSMECTSGFCVDGVCCEHGCGGDCRACNLGSTKGICSMHPAGEDPSSECAAGVCDGAGSCAEGVHLWSKAFGGPSTEWASSVAIDAAKNIYITGILFSTANFGGGLLTSTGFSDVYLAKFNAAGVHQWSDNYGDSSGQDGGSLAMDGSSNLFVSGTFGGTLNFGNQPIQTSVVTSYFAKLNSNAQHAWSKSLPNVVDAELAADAAGNVYLSGYFQNTINLGGSNLTSPGGSFDIFVARFDAGGNHTWSKRFGDASSQVNWGIAVDSNGDVILSGAFQGTVTFGGSTLSSAGGYDIYVAKVSSTGAHLWSKAFGSPSDEHGGRVKASPNGDVAMVGVYSSVINFGGASLVPIGGKDAFVAVFDSAGNHKWSGGYAGTYDQVASSVAFDQVGNLVIGGFFEGSINLGGRALSSAGARDIFVAKFASDGAHLWSKRFGGALDDSPGDVAVDTDGSVVVAGSFKGSSSFGGQIFTSLGEEDIFVAKFTK